MLFQERGKSYVAVEASTDVTDENSLAGGSEILIQLWGIPAKHDDLKKGTSGTLKQRSKSEWNKPGDLVARFFACEYFEVHQVEIAFLGGNRIQVRMTVADIDEESDDYCTTVWLDTQLMEEPTNLDRPT